MSLARPNRCRLGVVALIASAVAGCAVNPVPTPETVPTEGNVKATADTAYTVGGVADAAAGDLPAQLAADATTSDATGKDAAANDAKENDGNSGADVPKGDGP